MATESENLDAPLEAPFGLIPRSTVLGLDGLPKGLSTEPILGRDYKEQFEIALPGDLDRQLYPESK